MTGPTPATALPRYPQRLTYALLAASLLLMTIALYWPVTGNDFIAFDDPDYVTGNAQVQSGLTWAGFKYAFSTLTSANWHPLTMLSHMLDCQLFGLKPWGHHLTSLLLHALNAVLLFALLRQLTGATWRSFFVAALFAVHPLRVQSVAWVAERKDVLSGFFGLLTLLFYTRYALNEVHGPPPVVHGSRSKKQSQKAESSGKAVTGLAPRAAPFLSRITPHPSGPYLASLFCCALGLMSKAMLVTWPFVMLLLDYWPLERFKRSSSWRLVREKLPFFALAAAASVLTFAVQQHSGSVVEVEYLPLSARGANALISYCRYLGKLFWPADLAVFYPHPAGWPLPQVLLATGFLVGISAWVLAQRRRYPFLLVGWLWFLGTLVPVIGLVQVGEASIADRYTYLPLVGVLLLAIWSAYELTRRSHHAVLAVSVAGSVALLVCMVLTRQQVGYWKDGATLFRRALAVTINNASAHCSLGDALRHAGQTDAAISQYEEAVRLKPNYAIAHNSLGALLAGKGQTDAAISHYEQAIRVEPESVEAHNNLGNALFRQGQIDAAITQYQEVARLRPDYTEAHNNIGNLFFRKGQLDAAIRQYEEVIRLNPDHADAHYNLGTALGKKGQLDAAIGQFQAALRLQPADADAHYNLGAALAKKGQIDGAIRQFQETLRLRPDDVEAHYHLGVACSQQGQTDEAIRQFRETIRLRPDYAPAHNELGTALARKGQTQEAISHFQEALRLRPDYAEAQLNLDRLSKRNTPP